MSKQTPMLMESLITKRVYIVTSYVDNGNGMFTARQKYDVTEQFEAIAKQRKSGDDEMAQLERIAELEELVRDWQVLYGDPDLSGYTRLRNKTLNLGIEVIDE